MANQKKTTTLPTAVETAHAANSITLFRIMTDSAHTPAQLEAQGIDTERRVCHPAINETKSLYETCEGSFCLFVRKMCI